MLVAATAWLCGLSAGCGSSSGTSRVVHGHQVEGHWISPEAYVAHVEGTRLEAAGDLAGAERAYLRALEYDDRSADPWIRIGHLRCSADRDVALAAFARGLELEPSYAAGWSSRARCLSRHQQYDEALQAAQRAIQLDADASEPNLLVGELYARRDPKLARLWLLGLTLRNPGPIEHWQALRRHAADGSGLARMASREMARRKLPLATGSAGAARGPSARSALISGDLQRARLASVREGMPPIALARVAIEVGRSDLALQQCRWLLKARPGDADARVLGWLASVLEGQSLAGDLPPVPTDLGELRDPASAVVLEELIRWQVGERAASAWASAYRRRHPVEAPPTAQGDGAEF